MKYLLLIFAFLLGCEEQSGTPEKQEARSILCYSGGQVIVNLDIEGRPILGSTYVEFTDKDSGNLIYVTNASCIIDTRRE